MLIYNSETALKQEKYISNEFEYLNSYYVLQDSWVDEGSTNTIYKFLSKEHKKELLITVNSKNKEVILIQCNLLKACKGGTI